MNRLWIKQARLIDPSSGTDQMGDLLVENGVIAAAGTVPAHSGDCETLNATGLCLAPGLVDMHVHLRDPGFTHKEDILTGCAAAAAGGFTAVACMPNTKPACDSPEVVAEILGRAKAAKARVCPVAAITCGLRGEQRTDLAALREAGAVAVSDDGRPVPNNRLMLETLREAQEQGLCVISHAEDLEIVDGGIMHKGQVSAQLGVKGIDRASEDCNTAAVVALAESSGTRVHIAHVSTSGSVALIRDAKRRGAQVTCETGPHYFTLTDQKLLSQDANFRMNPPLREESDRLAILEGIADGTIDCIATDHAPHAKEEKAVFETAPNGVIGLETSLALCLTHLVRPGIIPLVRLIEMMSLSPARLLGIKAGTLQAGAPADLVLFDPEERWTVDRTRLHGKSENTCFDRMEVTGRVKYTLLGGRFTYRQQDDD